MGYLSNAWETKLATTIWILLNVSVVVGLVFVNKSILKAYANGIILTFVHMWTTCLAVSGAQVAGVFKAKIIPYREVFALALVNSLAIASSNLSLQHSPVSIYQIFKVLITPTVTILQSILWPSSVTIGNFLSLLLITIGGLVGVFTHSQTGVSFLGLTSNTAATVLSAVYQIMLAKKMKDLDASPNQLLYLQAPLNCLILLVYVIVFESGSIARIYAYPAFLGILLVGSLLAPLVNVSQTQVIHRTSPVMYNVVSQLKSTIIFLISIIFLHEHPTVHSIIGIVILQIGVVMYMVTKATALSSPTDQKEQEESSSTSTLSLSDQPDHEGKELPPFDSASSKEIASKLMPDCHEDDNYTSYFGKNRCTMNVIVLSLAIPVLVLGLPFLWVSGPVEDPSRLLMTSTPNLTLIDPPMHTPRSIHYIWANENQTSTIPMSVFLSVAASYNYVKPDVIYWHHSGTCNFTGEWWTRMLPMITLIVTKPPETIYGKKPQWIQHKADIMRLDIVNRMGGVYLDTDVVPVRSFDDLFALAKPVLGDQGGYALCNAFIMAPPNATLVKLWQHEYVVNYMNESWTYNSVEYPGILAHKYPNLAHVLPPKNIFQPTWEHCDQLVGATSVDLPDNYAVHFWASQCLNNYKPNITEILNSNSTFAKIAKPFMNSAYLTALDGGIANIVFPFPFPAPLPSSSISFLCYFSWSCVLKWVSLYILLIGIL